MLYYKARQDSNVSSNPSIFTCMYIGVCACVRVCVCVCVCDVSSINTMESPDPFISIYKYPLGQVSLLTYKERITELRDDSSATYCLTCYQTSRTSCIHERCYWSALDIVRNIKQGKVPPLQKCETSTNGLITGRLACIVYQKEMLHRNRF